MGCTQAAGLPAGKRADEEICLPDISSDACRESEARVARPAREEPGLASRDDFVGGLAPGSSVRVRGLLGDSATRLNGERGVLESWNASSNRWNVRFRSGEVKALRAENLDEAEVAGGHASQKAAPTQTAESLKEALEDPPLLEIWSRHRENSERAKAAKKILGGIDAPLKKLDLSVPPELLEQAKRSGGPDGGVDLDPDSRLLASVQDERIALDDLDSDLQLRASGVTTRRPVARRG